MRCRSWDYQEAVVVVPWVASAINNALFFPKPPISGRTLFYLKVYWRWPLVLKTKAARRWVCGTGGKIMTVGERITWRETCPYATLSTTNLTWTGLGSKSRLCGEMQSISVSPQLVVHGNARLTPHAGPLYIRQTRNAPVEANLLTTHTWHIQYFPRSPQRQNQGAAH